MSDRSYDLVLWGATGFTGRLVAAHVRDHAPADLRWAIGGRRRDALEGVAGDLGLPDLPVVVADAHDAAAMRTLAADTRVVCSTVGPYAVHGSALVAACAAEGTDYCDLTGELQWMRRMIDAHQSEAEASGARILHACGFDSIPFDLGVVFTQQVMVDRHGTPATAVHGRLKAMRGSASGGTIASMVNILGEAVTDADTRALLRDPYGLNPAGERTGPDGLERMLPQRDEDTARWSGPFPMSPVNTRVVRRTHALLGHPWGRDFRYDEAMVTGSGPVGALTAAGIGVGMSVGGVLGGLLSAAAPTRKLLERVLPDPGTGPSPAAQEKGFFDVRFVAEGPAGTDRTLRTRVLGDRDPGYGATSRMLGETALALAAGEATVGGGHWTPGAALGDSLLRRLPANAGVTFSVLD